MGSMLRNFLAAICGAILGGFANYALIILGGLVIPMPEGADFSKMILHFEPRHFLFPFLAHALGTLVAAVIIARFAVTRQLQLVVVITTLFFAGGLQMVMDYPSPMWFNITDLVLAYYPMGLLGYWVADKKRDNTAAIA